MLVFFFLIFFEGVLQEQGEDMGGWEVSEIRVQDVNSQKISKEIMLKNGFPSKFSIFTMYRNQLKIIKKKFTEFVLDSTDVFNHP